MKQNELEKLEKAAREGREILTLIYDMNKSLENIDKHKIESVVMYSNKKAINLAELSDSEVSVLRDMLKNRLIGLENEFESLKVK